MRRVSETGQNRQTGRQTDRQTDRHTDRQTGRQTGRETDRQTDRQTDRHADRQTDRAFLQDTTRNAAQVDGILWSPNGTLLNAPRPVATTASPPPSRCSLSVSLFLSPSLSYGVCLPESATK